MIAYALIAIGSWISAVVVAVVAAHRLERHVHRIEAGRHVVAEAERIVRQSNPFEPLHPEQAN